MKKQLCLIMLTILLIGTFGFLGNIAPTVKACGVEFSVSISPCSVVMDVGQSQQFTSTVTGGTAPCSYQWYLNYAPVSGANSSTWTFAPTSSGSYTVSLKITDSRGLLATSNTANVKVNAELSVSISPSSVVMDVGQSQLFTSTVTGGSCSYSYQWYLNGAAVSGATCGSWAFAPSSAGPYTVYLKVTDAEAQSATSNVANVLVNGQLSVSISPSSVVMDVGQSQLFTSTVVAGTSPYSYQWYLNGAAVSGANSSTWTFISTSVGSSNIYVKVTDSAGVKATSNKASVTVNRAPSVSISPSSVVMDVGQSQLFTSTVTGGTSPYSYQWYLNGAAVSGATNSSWAFAPSSAGSYTVIVKVTDSAGVKATSNTGSVTVKPVFSVSISPGSVVMDVGQSQLFTSTVTAGTSPYSYEWYLNGTCVSGATSSTWTFTPTSSGWCEIYVKATDGKGQCATSNTVTINVNGKLSVSITPSSVVMDVGQSQLFTSKVTAGTSPYSYQWYLNGAAVSGATSSTWTFMPMSAGSYTVYVKVTDAASELASSNTVNVAVNALHPALSVSVNGPPYAHEGDNISFTITIANPSKDTTMYGVDVFDSLLGDVSISFWSSLAPGASQTVSFSYTVPSPSGNLTNTVTATYEDVLQQQVTASASCTVIIIHPGISVSESGPAYADVGDKISFTITVSNTGDCALSSVSVSDIYAGTVFSGSLAVGASDTFTVNYTVPSGVMIVSDSVFASGSDILGRVVSSSSGWSVTVLHPGIGVSESGPTYAHVGDKIAFTITITNTGGYALSGVLVTDTLAGTIWTGVLAVGGSDTFTVNYTVPSGVTVVSDSVSASGFDTLGHVVSNGAGWSVTVLHPGISVSESGPSYAHVGDTVTFTITVSNTGDCALSGVIVSDTVAGAIYSGSLAVGASDTFTEPHTVPSGLAVVSDSVSASGTDGLNRVVSGSSGWSVTVLHPGISVSESGPSYAHVGDTVTFTITVSNTGDCALGGVLVTDSLFGTVYSGGLAFGASDTFSESYTVPSALAVVSDSVSASGSDVLGRFVSGSSGWSVTVLHPGISVSESGPSYAHVGDTVTFTITVSNTGDCALGGVLVTDSLFGTVYSGVLSVGASDTFSESYTVPSALAVVSDSVSASGSDALGGLVSANSGCSVTVLHPGVNVVKSGPLYAHEGDTITYMITINNTGDATITRVSVVDSLLGDVSSSFSSSLAPGASQTVSFSYTVPSPSGNLTNTVTATYEDVLQQQVTASASCTVIIIHPGISVSESGPAYAHVGDTATFTITVSNTGDCALSGVIVSDTVAGAIYSGSLAVGASDTFSVNYTVPSGLPIVSDSVSVSGSDVLGRVVSGSSGCSVTVLHPGVSVSESGPSYAHEGDLITFTITVSNTGDCALSGVFVSDSLVGTVFSGSLAVGASDTFTESYTVPSASTVISDSVSASGSDVLGGVVSANSGCSVTVLHPGVNVVKSGPLYANVGDTINYTITVTNTGDCDLTNVLVVDSLLGTIYSGSLAVGASDTFTVNYTVPSGLTVVSNTVSVSGSDVLGRVVSASSSWSVSVISPGLSISESGPSYAHEGDTISFTITINNTGDATITRVSVVDSLLGDVSSSFSSSLAPGASQTVSFSYTVPSPSGDITNTVTATYQDALQQQLTAAALWTVTVLHPSITVSKTAPTYAHAGDTITYTITVSNTGDCDLSSVVVSDSVLGAVYSGGLAVGASDTFTESYTVPSGLAVVSDTVLASGMDALGRSVSSSSSWSTTVLHPGISVSKTGPLYAHAGDTITYTITVNNTGDCPLNGAFVSDSLLGTIYSGVLSVGASYTFTVTYTVPSGLAVLSNTVTASGTDVLGGLVSSSSSWSVTVLHPGISVSKSAPANAHAGDTITYVITVSNTGDCTLSSVLVTDSLLGTVYSGVLSVGASDTFNVNYTVPSGLAVVSNTVSASGDDALGLMVSSNANCSVTVLHPAISVVKSGPTYAHVGDTITFTITVSNTGNCALSGVLVVDTVLGTVYSGSLSVGASDTFTESYTVPSGLAVVSDTVSASGIDGLGRSVSSSSSWSTTVLHPGINVSESAPTIAHVGDTVTFTITVSNTGDCALTGVLVTDTLAGTVYSGSLSVGASDTFNVNYTVPSGQALVSDSVSASGSDALGRLVSSSASCSVAVVTAETTVVVTNISMPAWVYQGWIVEINVTVKNCGNFSQPAWVTLYYNMTANQPIDAYPVDLAPGQSYTLTFGWNGVGFGWDTSNVPVCYGEGYNITAVITVPLGSSSMSSFGNIVVRIMGDVNGDGMVNMKDIALVARALGSTPTSPNWNSAADLNRDGIVNMKDLALVARNFGKIYNPD